ncbi:MAG TPA: DoxX family protein [Xanthobacteraceae bacterium]|jgi:putative oxidoreductase
MTDTNLSTCPICASIGGLGWALGSALGSAYRLLDRVPYAALAIPLRVAVATVFWNSGMAHLADWNTTLYLFANEYQVPFLPPDLAANLALSIEATTPVLLIFGLLTRPAAFVLLVMTTVIEVFVYPQAWPTHIQWAAMLLVLLCRGAGTFSLDYLIHCFWNRSPNSCMTGDVDHRRAA